MANLDLAFQLENGIILSETDTAIFSGTSDPAAGVGTFAAAGSLFLRTDGSFYLKTGALDTNWSRVLKNGDVEISIVQPSAGFTVTGGPISNSGTLTFALANDLAALELLSGSGFAVRTGADTWANRTISGGTNIAVTNGDGISGNASIGFDGVLPITSGGTGQITANDALNALLPAQVGRSGQSLITDGSNTSWSLVQTGGIGRNFYYCNTDASDITTYFSAKIDIEPAHSQTSIAFENTGTAFTLQRVFATASNVPAVETFQAGNFWSYIYAATGADNQLAKIRTEVYKRDTLGTETLISTADSDEFFGSSIQEIRMRSNIAVPVPMNSTDRLVFKIYTARISGPTSVFTTLYFEGNTAGVAITPLANGSLNLYDLKDVTISSAINGDVLTYNGTNWVNTSLASGTVTSVAAAQPAAGLTITGSPITTSGTLTFALANDLAALEGLASTGFAVRTGADTWANRTIGGGTGITVTNGDGSSGNITIDISPTYTGQSSITTLGTISSGTWNGTVIDAAFGGTGQTSYAIGDILYASSTTSLSKRSIGTTGQVLTVDSGVPTWSSVISGNSSGTVGVSPSGGGTSWTLIAGNQYRADFTHNLGTTNVVVTLWDTSNDSVVIANSLVALDTNTVRITVVGNTKTIKVVVVANGAAIVAGGSTPSSVITAFNGVTVSTAATKLNWSGQAVSVADAGSGTTNITIGSRFTFFSGSLDAPVNSDFAVNAIAASTTDPTYNSLTVRSFSDTIEQGVGCLVSVPPGATLLTIKMRGRPQTAPGTASVVQPRLYHRLLPNNSTVGAWSSAQELPNISIPTNSNFQYYVETISLSSLGMSSDNLYQIELTRRVSGVTGTNLAANYLMAELTLEFA